MWHNYRLWPQPPLTLTRAARTHCGKAGCPGIAPRYKVSFQMLSTHTPIPSAQGVPAGSQAEPGNNWIPGMKPHQLRCHDCWNIYSLGTLHHPVACISVDWHLADTWAGPRKGWATQQGTLRGKDDLRTNRVYTESLLAYFDFLCGLTPTHTGTHIHANY